MYDIYIYNPFDLWFHGAWIWHENLSSQTQVCIYIYAVWCMYIFIYYIVYIYIYIVSLYIYSVYYIYMYSIYIVYIVYIYTHIAFIYIYTYLRIWQSYPKVPQILKVLCPWYSWTYVARIGSEPLNFLYIYIYILYIYIMFIFIYIYIYLLHIFYILYI